MFKNVRCEEVVLQLVIRSYDESGRPNGEQITQPVKVFRNAQTRDVWAEVDKAVKAMQRPPEAPRPPKAPSAARKGTRKKR